MEYIAALMGTLEYMATLMGTLEYMATLMGTLDGVHGHTDGDVDSSGDEADGGLLGSRANL